MIRIFISVFFLVFFSPYSFSQNLKESDSTSIISFVDKFNVKINVDSQLETYTIHDKSSATDYVLSHNNELKLSISLDYEFLSLSVGFSPKFLPGNNDDNLKGETSYFEYDSRIVLGNWIQRFNYNTVQGYYLKNTNDFILNWIENKDPYKQLPNLKVTKLSGTTSYIIHENFSIKNNIHQTEWQRKSAGSFIPGIHYGFSKFSNNEDDLIILKKDFDVQLVASYYYTWVIHKNWFISSFLSPSLGIRFSNHEEEKNQHTIKGLDGGLQLGFNSEKYYFGVEANFDVNAYNEDQMTNIVDDEIYAKVYFGYRFKAPKILQKPVKWINKRIKSK